MALRYLAGFLNFQSNSNNACGLRINRPLAGRLLSTVVARQNDKPGLLRYL
jgi:hypothetical protein